MTQEDKQAELMIKLQDTIMEAKLSNAEVLGVLEILKLSSYLSYTGLLGKLK